MSDDHAYMHDHAAAYAAAYRGCDVETADAYATWYADAYGHDIVSAPEHSAAYHAWTIELARPWVRH